MTSYFKLHEIRRAQNSAPREIHFSPFFAIFVCEQYLRFKGKKQVVRTGPRGNGRGAKSKNENNNNIKRMDALSIYLYILGREKYKKINKKDTQ